MPSDLAASLAAEILQVARKVSTEEDLKIAVQGLLDKALEELGISNEVQYEKRVYRSRRADALYPAVVIEYKRPNGLASRAIQDIALDELRDYLRGLAGTSKLSRKHVGIAIDGFHIMFVRAKALGGTDRPPKGRTAQFTLQGAPLDSAPEVEIVGPVPVSAASVEQLLLYLRQLTRRTLSPEALKDDFGPTSEIGKRAVYLLWQQLFSSKLPKVNTLFSEWDRIFGIVYGEALDAARKDVKDLATMYGVPVDSDLKQVLFAIHTYFALLMKLIAAEILSIQYQGLVASFVKNWAVADDKKLWDELLDLESVGGLFKRFGITNFLEGDFFSWYLGEWDDKTASVLRDICRRLSEYEPATPRLESAQVTDLLKRLYQYLVPQSVRHDLGEYYTPDWLANVVLDGVEYTGDPEKRLLDPACGSGTFLVEALKRIIQNTANFPEKYGPEVLLKVLKNIVGFDINPLAVLAARTNYLIALTPLRHERWADVEIPIYFADSVLTPQRYSNFLGPSYPIRTTVGFFHIHRSLAKKGVLDSVLTILEDVIANKGDADVFLARISSIIQPKEQIIETLKELFVQIRKLEQQGRNRIWTRIIKNNFAPLYVGEFDYVVGNPPWIRWGYLAQDYRDATLPLWEHYGLFSLRGMQARLGGGEKDFSMLFLYACADSYLKREGLLGFLVTQEVVRAKGAGEGFRRFQIGTEGPELKVIEAHDFVDVKPFEDAANKTFMLVVKKNEKTVYPVKYIHWTRKKGVGRIPHDLSLSQARALTNRVEMVATPLGKPTDPWFTSLPGRTSEVLKMKGKTDYRAYTGSAVDPYGVYILSILGSSDERHVIVENLPDLGKNEGIKKVKLTIETDLLYPAIRGKDVSRWLATPSIIALIVQDPETRIGISEKELSTKLPKTYSYLSEFKSSLLKKEKLWKYYSKTYEKAKQLNEAESLKLGKYYRLKSRKETKFLYQATNAPFYTMFNIITETMSPWKVVWPMGSNDMKAAVTHLHSVNGNPKVVIPITGTMTYLPVTEEDEAHYVCCILNSSPVREYIKSFSSAGRGFGAPSIISHIRIPTFNAKDKSHLELATLSKRAHHEVRKGNLKEVALIEQKIKREISQFYGIDED